MFVPTKKTEKSEEIKEDLQKIENEKKLRDETIAKLQTSIENNKKTAEDLQLKIKQLERDVEVRKKGCELLEMHLDDLSQKCTPTRESIKKVCEQLQLEIDYNADTKVYQSALEEFVQKISQQSLTLKQSSENKFDEKNAGLNDSKERLRDLTNHNNCSKQEYANKTLEINKQRVDNAKELTTLKEKFLNCSERIVKLSDKKREYDVLEKSILKDKEMVLEKQEILGTEKKCLSEELEKNKMALQEKLKLQKDTNQDVMDKKGEFKQQLSQLNTKISDNLRTYEIVKHNNESLKKQYEDFEKIVLNLKTDVNKDIKNEIVQKEQELKEVTILYEGKEVDVLKLKEITAGINKECEDLEKESALILAKKTEILKEYTDCNKNINDIKSALEANFNKSEEYKTNIDLISNEIKNIETERIKENEDYEEALQSLKLEYNKLQEEKEAMLHFYESQLYNLKINHKEDMNSEKEKHVLEMKSLGEQMQKYSESLKYEETEDIKLSKDIELINLQINVMKRKVSQQYKAKKSVDSESDTSSMDGTPCFEFFKKKKLASLKSKSSRSKHSSSTTKKLCQDIADKLSRMN